MEIRIKECIILRDRMLNLFKMYDGAIAQSKM